MQEGTFDLRVVEVWEAGKDRLNFTNALEDGVQTEGWWADGTAKKGETI